MVSYDWKAILAEVMSVTEAAELWDIKPVTVRQACTGYSRAKARFHDDEARKSGSTWLVTKKGMERVFGSLHGKVDHAARGTIKEQ